nr:unnamed protein product [Digitaria exilis]
MQRFIPSEFGMDPYRMRHALEPGNITFVEKMDLRRAIEEANIPHTYISANCFAAIFCPNLCQMRTLLPPKEKVHVCGDGNVKDPDSPVRTSLHSRRQPPTPPLPKAAARRRPRLYPRPPLDANPALTPGLVCA